MLSVINGLSRPFFVMGLMRFSGSGDDGVVAGRRSEADKGVGGGGLRRAREAGGGGAKTRAARLLKVLPARIFLSPNGATKLRGGLSDV